MSNHLSKTLRLMTVKEVAELLEVTPEAIKKWVRELFPDKIKNGVKTSLTEAEVTAIKLKMRPTTKVVATKTNLEKELLIQQAMMFQQEKIQTMQYELDCKNALLEFQAPKVELADKCLRDITTMSITNAGKHLGIRQTRIFKIMRDNKYLTSKNVPTQKALDRKILEVRTNNTVNGNKPQAVMTMENIMNFSTRHLEPKGFATGGIVKPKDGQIITVGE